MWNTSGGRMGKLSNESYEAFAQHFAAYRRFKTAAQAAGSSAENLSQAGIELYERPEIQARVAELTKQRAVPLQMDAQRVMLEIARLSSIDYAGFYHPDGSQKLPHELTPDQSACVRGTDRNGAYQFWDKAAPITLLAKHHKIVGDEGDGVNALASALADRLKTARQRAEHPRPIVDSSDVVENEADEDLA